MTKVFFCKIPPSGYEDWYSEKMQGLPLIWQQKIARYYSPKDRLLRLCGKLLLIEALKDFGLSSEFSLLELKYSDNNKLKFPGSFEFNIAHSGDIAVCAASINGPVGIDIEIIAPVNISMLAEHFTHAEWLVINESLNPIKIFYHFWTRKEALLKAAGVGVFGNFNLIDTTKDIVTYNSKQYYLYPFKISPEYAVHLATEIAAEWKLVEVVL